MVNKFPESPGLYVAQNERNVILIKITGMYPTLQLGKALSIDKLITGNTVKEVDKEIMNHIVLFPEKWTFTRLTCVDMNAFPKLSFKPDSILDLSTDEKLEMRSKYYRLSQSGVSWTKIATAFVYEYKTTMDQILDLLNEFDKQSSHVNC